jgi:SAM-dependent methyltransferase
MNTVEYRFVTLERCNMCGADAGRGRVLGRRLNCRQGLRPQARQGIATTVVRCPGCGLVYPNPLPVPLRIEQHYGVPPESYWPPDYFEVDPNYMTFNIDVFRSLHGPANGDGRPTALDIGAGIGKGMIALSRAGFDAYGVEPSEPFYRRAIETMGVPADRIRHATVEEAEFGNAAFDFINFGAVLEHLVDPSAAIKNALAVLKPGGLIHAEVPSSAWLMPRLARLFYRATGSDYVINLSPMHAPFHLYEFTLESFRLHAAANGYSVVHHDHYVCDSYAPGPVKPLIELAMRWTRTGMQLAVWLRKDG